MIARLQKDTIAKLLQTFPVVALMGPRQVGKTTLAKELAQQHDSSVIYLDLELPSDLNKLQSPELYLHGIQGTQYLLLTRPGLADTLFSINGGSHANNQHVLRDFDLYVFLR